MNKIAVTNQKGGVGKTLTVLNAAHGLALRGYRVLMIDCDPQAALSTIYLRPPITRSMFDLLIEGGNPLDYIVEVRERLSLLPADPRLARLEGSQGDYSLKDRLGSLKGFDFILVDCGPSLGQLVVSVLNYVRWDIIPVKTDYFSLQALPKTHGLIEVVKELNPGLRILGHLPCQYDQRRILDREALLSLRRDYKAVFAPIRQNVSLAESVSWGQSIFEYRKRSTGAEDYGKLVKSIIKGVKA